MREVIDNNIHGDVGQVFTILWNICVPRRMNFKLTVRLFINAKRYKMDRLDKLS